MPIYHPWRDARRRGHLDIVFVDHLPAGLRGRITGDRIEMNRHMLSDERRCTIAHELVHDERRVFPRDRVLRAREELAVERIASRRGVSSGSKHSSTRCAGRGAADELWVYPPMLQAFVQSMSDNERQWVNDQMEARS